MAVGYSGPRLNLPLSLTPVVAHVLLVETALQRAFHLPLPCYLIPLKSPPAGLPSQGVGTFFWLLKHRVKLFSQDLTPSSPTPGARVGGVLSCVSRASAPLGTAHPPLFHGAGPADTHGTCFTHSSPRMPGFRGESPLKTLRQWVGERDWSSMGPPTAHLGPTNTVFGAMAMRHTPHTGMGRGGI